MTGLVKDHWSRILVIVLALAAGLVVLRSCRANSGRLEAKAGPMVEAVYGIGTVTARRTFNLKIGVTDTLTRLYIQEGQSVGSGQPLVAFGDGRVSRAPFSGLVTSLPYKEGETLFPQLPVLTLTDMRDPYLVVTLEQNAAVRVRKGQEALLSFENLRTQRLTGKVTSIYPKEGQFFVNIEVPGMPQELLVGMTSDVAIQVASREKVLQIPLSTVENGKVKVVRGAGGPTRTVAVKLGATDGMWAEVLEGDIQPGDKLVVVGKTK